MPPRRPGWAMGRCPHRGLAPLSTSYRRALRPRLLAIVAEMHGVGHAEAVRWRPGWHWSFPRADRHAMTLTHALACRGHCRLPPELWRHVFGFVERGWFGVGTPACYISGAPAASASGETNDPRAHRPRPPETD